MLNSITVFFFTFKNAPHTIIHLNGSYADVMFNKYLKIKHCKTTQVYFSPKKKSQFFCVIQFPSIMKLFYMY